MLTFAAAAPSPEMSVQSCVESLRQLFLIVISLAVAEAFKQFVSEVDTTDPAHRGIRWDRVFALVAFLALVLPFFHGMARSFFDTYRSSVRPAPYWRYLIIDTVCFTVEAVLFFALTNALDAHQWPRFYRTVVILLALNVAWGTWNALALDAPIWRWVWVNAATVVVLLCMLAWFSGRTANPNWIAAMGMTIIVARMVADYCSSLPFYFPPDQRGGSAVAMRVQDHPSAGEQRPLLSVSNDNLRHRTLE